MKQKGPLWRLAELTQRLLDGTTTKDVSLKPRFRLSPKPTSMKGIFFARRRSKMATGMRMRVVFEPVKVFRKRRAERAA